MYGFSTTRLVFATLAIATLGMCTPASAQEEQSPVARALEQRFEAYEFIDITVVPLEYASAEKVVKVMEPFGSDELMTIDEELNAVILFGPKEITAKLKEAIEVLDAAGKSEERTSNVELTVHLIQGWRMGTADTIKGNEIPAALEDVITELREVFTYNQYRVVDTLFLRCRDGSEASTSGVLPNSTSDSEGSIYQFNVERVSVTEGNPLGVRLDEIMFGATIPILSPATANSLQPGLRQIQRREVGIRADIDIREGQQVVVGKASVSGDESALFVVVSAKVVGG